MRKMQVIEKKLSDLEEIKTIPTGGLELDLALGGGIIERKVTLVVGGPGVGKTILALNIATNCVREGYKVVYIDSEDGLRDPKLIQGICYNGEAQHIKVTMAGTLEENCQIAVDGLKEDNTVVIFDSLTAAAPTLQQDKGLDAPQPGLLARVLSTFSRIVVPVLIKNQIEGKSSTLVAINQLRQNIQPFASSSFELPGGISQEYMATHVIFITGENTAKWFEEPSDDHFKNGQKAGKFLKRAAFKIQKHRVAVSKLTGNYFIVIKQFPDCNLGTLYNYSFVKRLVSEKIIDIKWFPQCKKVEDLCRMVLDYKGYKEVLKVLLDHNVGDILYEKT
jgi:RecA/RadA recombinase